MKRLPLYFFFLLILSACQEDQTTNELQAMIDDQALQESVQEAAAVHSAEVVDITADRKVQICVGPLFVDVLADFVARNQDKANQTCEIIRGPVSGCHEGFMTYGSGLVFPNEDLCRDFVKSENNPYH